MSTFQDGNYLTINGNALISKLLASKGALTFTRVSIGSGAVPDGMTPEEMTDVAQYVMDGYIAEVSNPVDGEASIVVQAFDAPESFRATEVMVWADDLESGELGYTYLYLSQQPEWVKSSSEPVGKVATFILNTIVDNVPIVQAIINPAALARSTDLQALEKRVSELEATGASGIEMSSSIPAADGTAMQLFEEEELDIDEYLGIPPSDDGFSFKGTFDPAVGQPDDGTWFPTPSIDNVNFYWIATVDGVVDPPGSPGGLSMTTGDWLAIIFDNDAGQPAWAVLSPPLPPDRPIEYEGMESLWLVSLRKFLDKVGTMFKGAIPKIPLQAIFDTRTGQRLIDMLVTQIAQRYHASPTGEYGVGNPSQNGHLRLVDMPDESLDENSGVAVSPRGLALVEGEMQSQIDDIQAFLEGMPTPAPPAPATITVPSSAASASTITVTWSPVVISGVTVTYTLQRTANNGSSWQNVSGAINISDTSVTNVLPTGPATVRYRVQTLLSTGDYSIHRQSANVQVLAPPQTLQVNSQTLQGLVSISFYANAVETVMPRNPALFGAGPFPVNAGAQPQLWSGMRPNDGSPTRTGSWTFRRVDTGAVVNVTILGGRFAHSQRIDIVMPNFGIIAEWRWDA